MRKILLAFLVILLLSITVTGQNQVFTRDGLDYVLELPSPSWRAVSRIDVHEHYEFINGEDLTNGYLRLRKRLTTPGTAAADLFREDEQSQLQKLSGYVACSNGQGIEFVGHLKGAMFSYEYVNQGKNMDGRIYYLQLDSRTFYTLRFTVASDKLQGLRAQMDSIARSFRLK